MRKIVLCSFLVCSCKNEIYNKKEEKRNSIYEECLKTDGIKINVLKNSGIKYIVYANYINNLNGYSDYKPNNSKLVCNKESNSYVYIEYIIDCPYFRIKNKRYSSLVDLHKEYEEQSNRVIPIWFIQNNEIYFSDVCDEYMYGEY